MPATCKSSDDATYLPLEDRSGHIRLEKINVKPFLLQPCQLTSQNVEVGKGRTEKVEKPEAGPSQGQKLQRCSKVGGAF